MPADLRNSGAGPIGLVTLLASHAAGCTPIAITDIIESRLEFAKKLIPSVKTILLNKGDGPETNAQRIQDALGMRPRVAMECTGFESSITAAIYVRPLAHFQLRTKADHKFRLLSLVGKSLSPVLDLSSKR